MADICLSMLLNAFLDEKLLYFDYTFVVNGLIDNMYILVQIMACHQSGDKPLPVPMINQFPEEFAKRSPGTNESISFRVKCETKEPPQYKDTVLPV